MKAAIVTLFDEYPNFGSFLQAFALQKSLDSLGVPSEFLVFPGFRRTRRKLKYVITKDTKRLLFNIKRALLFQRNFSQMKKRRFRPNLAYDLVVLGSDEIWNLKNPTFDHHAAFFGVGFISQNTISYAPSTAGLDVSELESEPVPVRALHNIQHLSGRDRLTCAAIKTITGRDATKVLDPTFLIDWALHDTRVRRDRYILVYCYRADEIVSRFLDQLRKAYGIEVVCIGHYSGMPYECLNVDSFEFLGYIRGAECVVTDSFHGTILSVQYRKQFFCFAKDKYKILDFLEEFDLQHADVSGADCNWDLGASHIDYDALQELLSQRISASFDFLRHSVGREPPGTRN